MTKEAEKSGNTIWAQCPDCGGWLPVSPEVAAGKVAMHCPHCGAEFPSGRAARIVQPGDET